MDQSSTTPALSHSNWLKVLLFLIFLACMHLYRIKQSWQEIPAQPSDKLITQVSVIPAIEWSPLPQETLQKGPEHWSFIKVKPGDSLALLFNKAGISSKTLQQVLQGNPHAKLLTHLKPGQTLQVLITHHQLDELILPLTNDESLSIKRQDTRYITQYHTNPLRLENQLITATVKNSLYETAKQAHIPYALIQQMTNIFHWEINFAREVHTGDQFTILYSAYYNGHKLVKIGEILALNYTTRHKTYQAIRHQVTHDNSDYFSPDGTSLKLGFSRYPLEFSRISSLFSLSRIHPLLHYRRPHQGIDLAAPTGTPVRATGDGRIEKINREAGYGNMIKISHQNTAYASIYAHLLRFEKGLRRGTYVKRGQIIGYVGQTGLADGPHCHYEVHVSGHEVDPVYFFFNDLNPEQYDRLLKLASTGSAKSFD